MTSVKKGLMLLFEERPDGTFIAVFTDLHSGKEFVSTSVSAVEAIGEAMRLLRLQLMEELRK